MSFFNLFGENVKKYVFLFETELMIIKRITTIADLF